MRTPTPASKHFLTKHFFNTCKHTYKLNTKQSNLNLYSCICFIFVLRWRFCSVKLHARMVRYVWMASVFALLAFKVIKKITKVKSKFKLFSNTSCQVVYFVIQVLIAVNRFARKVVLDQTAVCYLARTIVLEMVFVNLNFRYIENKFNLYSIQM